MTIKRHISHIKSKVRNGGKPQLPEVSAITYGEIAINYADGIETISLKNDQDEIKTFSSDDYYTEQKLGSGFTGDSRTVTEVIIENEIVTAQAINELDTKLDDFDTVVSASLNDLRTNKTDVIDFVAHTSSTVHMDEIEKRNLDSLNDNIAAISGISVTDVANWNDANSKKHTHANKAVLDGISSDLVSQWNKQFDDAKYETSGAVHVINFYHDGTIKATIDASDFLIDGMVDDVRIEDGYLVIIFNTDSGKQTIRIPLTDIFDPDNYYTKLDIDNKLGSAFTGSDSVTDVIVANEKVTAGAFNDINEKLDNFDTVVSASLNDLRTNKTDITDFVVHTASTVHMNASEKENLDSLATNITAISGITSTDITQWNKQFDDVKYENSGETKVINFYHNSVLLATLDATEFLIDGMVEDVVISGGNLVISFNEDAHKSDIIIPLTDIFDPSKYYTKIDVDDKLGSGFTGVNSGKTVTEVIVEDEQIVSEALNELNDVLTDHVSNDTIHVTAFDKVNWNGKTDNAAFTAHTASTVHMNATEKTNLDSLATNISAISGITSTDIIQWNKQFDDAKYEDSGSTKVINFYHNGTIKATIDATDFIVDGMVDNVIISGDNLVITFNTDSGKQPINIPLTDIFDPDNYYSKLDIDNKLGSAFTGSDSVTDVIVANEKVTAAAFNNINDVINNLVSVSGNTLFIGFNL